MAGHSPNDSSARRDSDLVLPEGIEAGLVGGVAVAAAFVLRDVWTGHWLHTPSVLGTLMLSGPEAARLVVSDPAHAALYHAAHFGGWIALGFVLAGLCARLPGGRAWLGVIGIAMVAGLVAVDLWLGPSAQGRLHLWLGGIVGAAAVARYLAWRHPELNAAGP